MRLYSTVSKKKQPYNNSFATGLRALNHTISCSGMKRPGNGAGGDMDQFT